MLTENYSDKVTIYLTTCNRVDKLQRAVASVLNQSHSNFELIICDDASKDGTEEYAKNLTNTDCRVKYVRNEMNLGACNTRNLGIFSATGKYITGLDDDDEFKPTRLQDFLKYWSDEFSFICCDFIERFKDGKEKKYYNKKTSLECEYQSLLFDNIASNQIFTLTERLQGIGGFDTRVKRLQDWDTWLRLAYKYGSFKRIPIATYIMNHDHIHGEVRVSKSYSLDRALDELLQRNISLYSESDQNFMKFIISTVKGDAKFSEGLFWSIEKRNFKHLAKCIINFKK